MASPSDSSADFPLPPDLPQPVDDGAAKHLQGMPLPRVSLPSTAGRMVDLSGLPAKIHDNPGAVLGAGLRAVQGDGLSAPRIVLYCYPMTGVPGHPLPEGWDAIPGARGCTPQTCGFRDHYQEIVARHAVVFGLSTQTSPYQREMAERLHLPFEILSDGDFEFCDALRLPTFTVGRTRLVKRITLIARDARIKHVFYPVFPPNQSASEVLHWLASHPLAN